MSEKESLPQLPDYYTSLDRQLLEQIRDVWQSLVLPKPADWVRDIDGVRLVHVGYDMIIRENDFGLGPEAKAVNLRSKDIDGYVWGRDDERRRKHNIAKANDLTWKINTRFLMCEWLDVMDFTEDYHVGWENTFFSNCSIQFDEERERYYMPKHVYFCVKTELHHVLLYKRITDHAAINYVRAGRDEADFGPSWRDYQFPKASNPVSQPKGLARQQTKRRKSARPSELAKQRNLFRGDL